MLARQLQHGEQAAAERERRARRGRARQANLGSERAIIVHALQAAVAAAVVARVDHEERARRIAIKARAVEVGRLGLGIGPVRGTLQIDEEQARRAKVSLGTVARVAEEAGGGDHELAAADE